MEFPNEAIKLDQGDDCQSFVDEFDPAFDLVAANTTDAKSKTTSGSHWFMFDRISGDGNTEPGRYPWSNEEPAET